MRSEDSILRGTVVAQCLHSMRTICQAVFLSLHIHMAPQISMAEGPLSWDVMDFDTFITATEDTFSSIPVCNESNLLGAPNGNFNKVWQVSKGRATLKCSFFLFWHFVIGFALMDGRCRVNSFRKAKEVNKWIALKYRKHGCGFPCPHITIWPFVDGVCVSLGVIDQVKRNESQLFALKGGRRLVEASGSGGGIREDRVHQD